MKMIKLWKIKENYTKNNLSIQKTLFKDGYLKLPEKHFYHALKSPKS